jgi:hypothetical protein
MVSKDSNSTGVEAGPFCGQNAVHSGRGKRIKWLERPTRRLVTSRAAAALSVLIGCVTAQSHPPSGSWALCDRSSH